MEDLFYIGGYFIVKPAKIEKWQNKKLLPKIIWTPSHLCDIYPGAEGLSWASDTKESKKWEKELMLSNEEAIDIRKLCDELFELEKLGWLSVFLDLESVDLFMSAINPTLTKDWKILCIATTKKYVEEYIEFFKQEEGSNVVEGEYGVRKMLRKTIVCPDIMNGFRGFEILGCEYGFFHSFMCHSMENDYSKKLGIHLNKNGLIDNFKDAEKASDFTRSPLHAEPALWQPWAIIEITAANNLLHRSAISRGR
jgi:hypothetical protein